MIKFLAQHAIVVVFVLMFLVAVWGTILVQRLNPYMASSSWTVRRWSFVLLMVAQVHGIGKTLWSDHHFNWHDVAYFAELLLVYCGLNVANTLLLRDWKRFPMLRSSGRKQLDLERERTK